MRRLLLALLLPLAIPASAPAAGVPTGPLEGGPILVEDGVLWFQRDGLRRYAVMGGRPDGTVRRLRSEHASSWSSDGSIATVTIDSELWTGTVGDGLRPLDPAPEDCSPTAAELDGGVMAIACGGYENYSVVLRRRGLADRSFETATAAVAVAGRYAAWSRGRTDNPSVVLYDTIADREVLPARRFLAGYPLTLQPDGTMLVGSGGSFDEPGLAWLSPAEPKLHRLDIERDSVRGFARDRLLTLEDDPSSHVWGSSLGVSLRGLDGSRRTVASTRGLGRIVGSHYDGSRIAVAYATCNGSRILFRSATAPAYTPPAPRLCTLIVTKPPVFEFNTRDRPRIGVNVRCADRTLRVCGDLVVRTGDGQQLSRVSYQPNHDARYNVYLDDRAVRRVARDGGMTLRLEMLSRGAAQPLQGPTTATLRAEPEDLTRLRRCVRSRPRPASACPD